MFLRIKHNIMVSGISTAMRDKVTEYKYGLMDLDMKANGITIKLMDTVV
jgi:hypothetical protein